MSEKAINKIIYFDKDTIQNILQEKDQGRLLHTTDILTSMESEGNIEVSDKVNLGVHFLKTLRISV